MMDFGRMERILYLCRINLYWWDEDGEVDLRDAELVAYKDEEITIKDKKGLYWSWNIDVLEAKVESLADEHADMLRKAFKELKAE